MCLLHTLKYTIKHTRQVFGSILINIGQTILDYQSSQNGYI